VIAHIYERVNGILAKALFPVHDTKPKAEENALWVRRSSRLSKFIDASVGAAAETIACYPGAGVRAFGKRKDNTGQRADDCPRRIG